VKLAKQLVEFRLLLKTYARRIGQPDVAVFDSNIVGEAAEGLERPS
jgi:hypothetical protein